MTASPRPPRPPASFTSPVIDCEPPPEPIQPVTTAASAATRNRTCPPPSAADLRRGSGRPGLRPAQAIGCEPPPSREAAAFADAALRRVLEVIDRRRPVGQLRPLVGPTLVDAIVALAQTPRSAAATLRRVRLRPVDRDGGHPQAAEVFATYTRDRRTHAIAARVENVEGRWQLVALQIG